MKDPAAPDFQAYLALRTAAPGDALAVDARRRLKACLAARTRPACAYFSWIGNVPVHGQSEPLG